MRMLRVLLLGKSTRQLLVDMKQYLVEFGAAGVAELELTRQIEIHLGHIKDGLDGKRIMEEQFSAKRRWNAAGTMNARRQGNR